MSITTHQIPKKINNKTRKDLSDKKENISRTAVAKNRPSYSLKINQLSKAVLFATLGVTAFAAHADDGKRYFNIEKNTISEALKTFAVNTDSEILFAAEVVGGKETRGVVGEYTDEQALEMLLSGTELVAEKSDDKVYLIKAATNQNTISGSDAGGAKSPAKKFSTNRRIDEIIVSAQKREERLLDVPMSITALSGDEIDTAGMQNIIDLSYAVPNLSVREEGPGQQTIVIRGMGNAWGSSPLVGIYLDEVPVSAFPTSQIDLQTLDLARVEVLKGPQGSLYGQGAVGGTIRFITQDPSFDGIDGKAGISLYDTHKGDMSEEVTGVLNLPVVDDVLAFRVAGTYKNKGGWIDQPAIDDKNINDNELTNIRVKALWQPTDQLTIKAMTIHHQNEAGGANYVNLRPISDSQFEAGVDPSLSPGLDDDYEVYNLTINYQFEFATLTSSTSYFDLDKAHFNRTQFVELAVGSLETAISASQKIKSFSQELRLSSHQEQRLTWTVGAFYSDLKMREAASDVYRALNGTPLPFLPLAADKTENPETVAVFGGVAYALTEQLTMGVGSRYFEDAHKLTNHLNGVTFNEDFDNISSRLYVSYALNDQANLYASVAQGFRSGGFNAAATATLPLAYEPDEVINYEVGVKATLFDRRLSAELSLYYADYADLQGVVVKGLLGPAEERGIINGGDAEIKGVEWQLQWAVTDALSLGFSGNVTDAEVVSLPGSDITPDKNPGDPLDFVPEYNYSLTGNYHFVWSPAVPGYAQLSYHRQGPSSYISRLIGALDPVSEASSIGFLNLQLGARFQNIDLQLFARNLLDEDGATGPDLFTQLTPQARPRSIGVNLTYQF